MKINPLLIIKLALGFFMCIGIGLAIFMAMQGVKITGAYIVAGLFIAFPGLLLYGLIFGFTISENTVQQQNEIQEAVLFDHNGILYQLPLFKMAQFIQWNIIEAVTYTNYQSDDQAQLIFYLAQPPRQTTAENPAWYHKIAAFISKNKTKIRIADDCKNFELIPEMLEKYLVHINPIDLSNDGKKGMLISTKTTIKNNRIKTESYWKPDNNYQREKVLYDKYNRTFGQIK